MAGGCPPFPGPGTAFSSRLLRHGRRSSIAESLCSCPPFHHGGNLGSCSGSGSGGGDSLDCDSYSPSPSEGRDFGEDRGSCF
mmetsp:Transcript_13867/g.34880  ORF Transcript_13867/g.34880 Transcript_13867/m.34880 type:complete len:82 (-) Transcript_13867:545-790(-)